MNFNFDFFPALISIIIIELHSAQFVSAQSIHARSEWGDRQIELVDAQPRR